MGFDVKPVHVSGQGCCFWRIVVSWAAKEVKGAARVAKICRHFSGAPCVTERFDNCRCTRIDFMWQTRVRHSVGGYKHITQEAPRWFS